MIKDLENQLNILEETPSLLVDIGGVLDIDEQFLTAESSTKAGKYENVIVLGTHKPVKDEKGLILFVGKYKYPCFLPLRNLISLSGETVQ